MCLARVGSDFSVLTHHRVGPIPFPCASTYIDALRRVTLLCSFDPSVCDTWWVLIKCTSRKGNDLTITLCPLQVFVGLYDSLECRL